MSDALTVRLEVVGAEPVEAIVEVLRPKPGEVVVFRADGPLPSAVQRRIGRELAGLMPEGVRVALLEHGHHLQLVQAPGDE